MSSDFVFITKGIRLTINIILHWALKYKELPNETSSNFFNLTQKSYKKSQGQKKAEASTSRFRIFTLPHLPVLASVNLLLFPTLFRGTTQRCKWRDCDSSLLIAGFLARKSKVTETDFKTYNLKNPAFSIGEQFFTTSKLVKRCSFKNKMPLVEFILHILTFIIFSIRIKIGWV